MEKTRSTLTVGDYQKSGNFIDLDYTETEGQNYLTLNTMNTTTKFWLTTQTNLIGVMDTDCSYCKEQTLIRTNLPESERNKTAEGYADNLVTEEMLALTFETLRDVTFSGKKVNQEYSSYVEELNKTISFNTDTLAVLDADKTIISELSGFIGIAPVTSEDMQHNMRNELTENFLLNMKDQGLIDHLIVTLIND